MRVYLDLAQALLLVAGAPLVRGIIARLKAWIQRRQGASIWRPYADLGKLFGKEDLVPPAASPVFRFAPVLLFAVIVLATGFVPVLHSSALFGTASDFILLVYLIALGRFFMSLGAIDGGSAFGGMGASREALVSTLAEAPLLLSLMSVAILAHSGSISDIVSWTLRQNFFDISLVHALAFAALVIVGIAETGRLPVDNPTTHLELTMIHEAMVLEYSGPSLAFIEWAQAIKLNLVLALLIGLFGPWGMATGLSASVIGISIAAYLLKLGVLIVTIALVESSLAKLRMYLVPDFLGVGSALGILAIMFTAFTGR
jgi:formate hydrogenlyase subunit 4